MISKLIDFDCKVDLVSGGLAWAPCNRVGSLSNIGRKIAFGKTSSIKNSLGPIKGEYENLSNPNLSNPNSSNYELIEL